MGLQPLAAQAQDTPLHFGVRSWNLGWHATAAHLPPYPLFSFNTVNAIFL